MASHGGRLLAASRRHDLAPDRWLDLSTGISPWSWIAERGYVPPPASWLRLPEDDDALGDIAAATYGAAALPVAGSQAAIQLLPGLRPRSRVGVLHPTYAEHALRWQQAGHRVQPLGTDALQAAAEALDVIVLCNPNNPDGQHHGRAALLDLHQRLARRGGWLIVDEAYADAEPAQSLARDSTRPGLVVLRSLGKFYGLAGARVGFVLAAAPLRGALQARLGPWSLAGPSRAVAAAALADHAWRQAQCERLVATSERLRELLEHRLGEPAAGCALFRHLRLSGARALAAALARQGILVRRFRSPEALRFGLPGTELEWRRLDAALCRARRPETA